MNPRNIEIADEFRQNPSFKNANKLCKKYSLEFGKFLRIISNEKYASDLKPLVPKLRANNKLLTIERLEADRAKRGEQRGEKKEGRVKEQITKVLEARRAKPFKLKMDVNDGRAELIKKKLDAINNKQRRDTVTKFKKKIYEVRYQDVRPSDKLSARESMLVFDEEQKINVNRLHYRKVKRYTPYILDSQCFNLDEKGLSINSIKNTIFPIIVNDETSKKKLEKYYNRKDLYLKIFYPKKKDGKYTGECYADLFIQQPYPKPYIPDYLVEIVANPKELEYNILFLNPDGNEIRKTKTISLKNLIKKERESQKSIIPKQEDYNDYEEFEKALRNNQKKYYQYVLPNLIKGTLRLKMSQLLLSVEELKNNPLFVFPYINFPTQTSSPNKDWNFAQNKQLHIREVKTTLTGMAWRKGFEVIQLSLEDSTKEDLELFKYCKSMIGEAHEIRKKKEERKETKQQKATVSKGLKKKLGRKPTEEEKEKAYIKAGLKEPQPLNTPTNTVVHSSQKEQSSPRT